MEDISVYEKHPEWEKGWHLVYNWGEKYMNKKKVQVLGYVRQNHRFL